MTYNVNRFLFWYEPESKIMRFTVKQLMKICKLNSDCKKWKVLLISWLVQLSGQFQPRLIKRYSSDSFQDVYIS